MSQQDILAGIMEGMAQPIKMRIMQVRQQSLDKLDVGSLR